jgi:hypothetical protein
LYLPVIYRIDEQSHIHMNQDKINYYVNSEKFEDILFDLVNYLNLSDIYTLFIINPHHPFESTRQRYGYRYVPLNKILLSNSEKIRIFRL